MNNDEEPSLKKNKLQTEPTLNLSLPDDLIVRILARLSRLYYPTLFFVSKHFCSLLTSHCEVHMELYKTRSLLGRTENCLYVCLRIPNTDSIPRWFMLFRRPNRNLTNGVTKKKKNKSNGYIFGKNPNSSFSLQRTYGWNVLAVGSNIYKIGGCMNGSPSTSVSILDCWSHTWLQAPSMRVEYPSANLLDGKIYVTGGCHKQYNWMEVFDLKTKTWEYMLSPAGSLALYSSCDHINNVVVDGKLYIIGDKMGVAYDPEDGSWNILARI